MKDRENNVYQYEYLRDNMWKGEWSQRILSEMGFLLEMSRVKNGAYDHIINPALDQLYQSAIADGAITRQMAEKAEEALMELSQAAKQYRTYCVAHAHIDMNWMWGYQETASITVDTFRTMLTLMREYPQFTFSQSQASVYHIIEEYYPEMLKEIRQRVQEGRWEVTASSWVENDKNMSGGEAMARHLLYTKRYLSKLLQIPEEMMEIDFEPDTFGHNENMPEILNNGGVKYYYHCRGYDKDFIYNWEAPSGASVLVYRDSGWYNSTIESDMLIHIPEFCEENHTNLYLKVYGVGDHGGGPTRRDIERILDMMNWPLYPEIRFGTLHGFFHELEKMRCNFNTVRGELNYVFTGCYTSQSEIKRANHMAEDRIYDAEALDFQAKMVSSDYTSANSFEKPWRRLLFNQFHDILPGSGVKETREYAMGEFQKIIAAANINSNHSMNSICERIDTSLWKTEKENPHISFGAGVGFATGDNDGFRFTQTERGNGKTRVYTLFNTTQYNRSEIVKLTIWDWQGKKEQIVVEDSNGNQVECQPANEGTFYWGHRYTDLYIKAMVPAMGYATYVVKEKPASKISGPVVLDPRCDYITDEPIIMENDKLKAVFCRHTMKLISLKKKDSEKELVNTEKSACEFRYIQENPVNGMASWRVGPYSSIVDLNETSDVKVMEVNVAGIHKTVKYQMTFEQSSLSVVVSLDEGSNMLRFEVKVDWHEIGTPQKNIPQLGFAVPLDFSADSYRYNIPFGTIDRSSLPQDVPANSIICGLPAEKDTTLALLADCKYGYRGADDTLYVDLIRSSYEPDLYPENGLHNFTLGVAVIDDPNTMDLLQCVDCFLHPVYACSNGIHSGELPLTQSLCSIDKELKLSSVKQAEDGGLVLRLYNPGDKKVTGYIQAHAKLSLAERVDFIERNSVGYAVKNEDTVMLELEPHKIETLKITKK